MHVWTMFHGTFSHYNYASWGSPSPSNNMGTPNDEVQHYSRFLSSYGDWGVRIILRLFLAIRSQHPAAPRLCPPTVS